MSFFIKKTKLKNVFVLNFSEFKDHRGKYIESYNKKFINDFKKLNFVQDDFSI